MNKKTSSISVVFFLFLVVNSFGQQSWKEDYDKAKQVYQLQKYEVAMELFLPVTSPDASNPYAPYAQYYYSLSAYYAGKYTESRQMLLQLMNSYPNWNQINEAEYLLSAVYFELKKYRFAITMANEVDGMSDAITDLKKKQYVLIEPLDSLKKIQADYPNDKDLAEALFNRLQNSVPGTKDRMLYEYLAQEYKFEIKSVELTFVKKASYHVAVLLPFNLKELVVDDPQRSNQYILDMYQGILAAVDSLKLKGVNVILHPYDTDKEVSKIQTILQYPEMRSVDLIIGPLHPALIPYVTEFAERNRIPVINPFSLNSKITENTTQVLLFQPALEAIAGTVSEFAKSQFVYRKNVSGDDDKKPKNEVIIFYTSDVKDSLLALYYRDSLLVKGFKVLQYVKVTKATMSAVTKVLSDSLALLRTSHIFVSSADPALASNVISGLEISRQYIPIVTKSEWLDINSQTFDQYERRKVYFIYPDFVEFYTPAYQHFKHAYTQRFNAYPSKYSVLGYEMMTLTGAFMKQYGTGHMYYLRKSKPVKGQYVPGFNYAARPYNMYVPILYFNDLKLTLANPIQ